MSTPRPQNIQVSGLKDLEQLEQTPFEQLNLPTSTYALLDEAKQQHGHRTPMRFLLEGNVDDCLLYTSPSPRD